MPYRSKIPRHGSVHSFRLAGMAVLFLVCTTLGCRDKPDRQVGKTDSDGSSAGSETQTENSGTQNSAHQPKIDEKHLLKSLSVAEFKQSYLVDVEAQNQPAREVLTDLLNPIGLRIDEDSNDSALQMTVSLQLSQVPRLQAVEEISRRIGVTPEYPGLDDGFGGLGAAFGADENDAAEKRQPVRFRSGPRRLPVSFAGPAIIEIAKLSENPPTATGRVAITIRAFDLPSSVAKATDSQIVPFKLKDIVNDSGESLIMSDSQGGFGAIKEDVVFQSQVKLENLLQDIQKIAAIRGVVQFQVPTDIQSAVFRSPEENAKQSVGGVEFTITQFRETGQNAWSVGVRLQGEDLNIRDFEFLAFDSAGQPLKKSFTSSFGGGGSGQANFRVNDRPASLMITHLAQMETLEFPWELANVPLQKFAEQPKELSPLEFSGDDAVTAEVTQFTRGNFPKLLLQVTNHSNKDVARLDVLLHYLNEADEVLKTEENSLFEPFDEPIVARMQKTEVEESVALIPEQATEAELQLKTVTFSDGTTWNALVRPLPESPPFDPEKEAPVSLAVETVSQEKNFRKVTLAVKNFSPRDVTSIQYTLHYLDPTGKEKTHNASETGSPQMPESVVLPKRSRTLLVVTAFFMPENATQVRATVRSVTFADGETWQASYTNADSSNNR